MSQVGQTLWKKSQRFSSMKALVQFIREHIEDWKAVQEGFEVYVSYDRGKGSQVILRGVSAWEPNLFNQIEFRGKNVQPWEYLDEEF